jgi:hypothetical protein
VRDFMGVVRAIEGLYPKAKGTLDANFPNQDDQLRIQITPFANELLRELERARRWRLSWRTAQQVTSSPTNIYTFPLDVSTIKRIWWRRSSGSIQVLRRSDEAEIRLIKGEPPSGGGTPPPLGEPRFWAQMPPLVQSGTLTPSMQFAIWPAPDNAGPDSGNYTLQIDYYSELLPIVETVASTTAALGILTLVAAQAAYVNASGAISLVGGGLLTVRGAGNATGITVIGNDDFTTGWTGAIGTSTALSTPAPNTAAGVPTYFNSVNWLIRSFPKVIVFGMLREVASYLSALQDYQRWEARYQKELEQLIEWDDDTESGVEVMGVATQGQLQPIFRDLDLPELYDIRGGGP